MPGIVLAYVRYVIFRRRKFLLSITGFVLVCTNYEIAYSALEMCAQLFVSVPSRSESSTWRKWVQQWYSVGHAPQDIERISQLVRQGLVSERLGRAIVDEGAFDTLRLLQGSSFLTPAEFEAIETAFRVVKLRKPLGEPERIPTISYGFTRRTFVLAQEYRGDSMPETERGLVLMDTVTKRKLANMIFRFEGYKSLVIDSIFTVKSERGQLLAELMFAELLRRYPSIETASFEMSATEVRELRKSVSGLKIDELILASPAYNIASRFGFRDFRLHRRGRIKDEDGIRIVARLIPAP